MHRSEDSMTAVRVESPVNRRIIPSMRAGSPRPGSIAVLLLLCMGVGVVSAALFGDTDDPGYYDGDGDDAAVPQRFEVQSNVVICAAGLVRELPTPGSVESSVAAGPPLIIEPSRPPLLRSPPSS